MTQLDSSQDTWGPIDPLDRTDRWMALAVIVLALAVRLFYLTGIEAYPKFELIKNRLDDQVVFDAWAKTVVQGEVFDYRTTGHEFAHWVDADPGVYPQAPLYPFLISAFYAVFGFDYDGWRVAQMALGALACGLLFWLSRRYVNRWAAFLAGLGLAFYGPQVFYEGTMLRAGIFTAVGLIALERLVRLVDALDSGDTLDAEALASWRLRVLALTTGLALAAGTLLRPNFLLFAFAALVWLAWLHRTRFVLLRQTLAWTLLGLIVPLLPVMAVNSLRSGHPAFLSSNGPYIFFVSNVHDASGTSATPSPYYFQVKSQGTAPEVDLMAEALRDIRRHPAEYLARQGRKLLAFFGPWETPNNLSFEMALETNPRLQGAFVRLPHVLPWALLGLWFARRREHVPLHLFLGCYAVGTVLFYVLARLRLPVVPVLLILAALALDGLWRRWRRGEHRVVVGCLAGWTLLVSSFWPLLAQSDGARHRPALHRSADYAMAAAAHHSRAQDAEGASDMDLAWRHYARSLALNPQHHEALVALRRLAPTRPPAPTPDAETKALLEAAQGKAATGELEAAEALLRQAVQRAPDSAEPYHFLSNVAYLDGDLAAVGRHLESAVQRAPLVDLYRQNLTTLRDQQSR